MTRLPPALVVSSGVQGLAVTRGLGEQGVPGASGAFTRAVLAHGRRYAGASIFATSCGEGADRPPHAGDVVAFGPDGAGTS